MAFASINTSGIDAPAPMSINIPAIEEAFAAEPSLKKRVYDAISSTPQHAPLFEDIARYTTNLQVRKNALNTPVSHVQTPSDGPAAKKRKLQNGDGVGNGISSTNVKADAPLQFYMKDVSFAVPQRKKFTLEITTGQGLLRARNQTSKEVEFGVPIDRIQHILCLPVPEKTQRQFNFCVIPCFADGINAPPEGETAAESMVWTIADGPPKTAFSGNGQQLGTGGDESAEGLIRRILNENLTQTKVVRPDDREFVSAMPEPHRKTEKAYHVKAFRGSKEGYLFFLSNGILFGFKKPLVFFSFENIESISYTSVLQRTFNLNVIARPTISTGDDTMEFEFSMIDQADYAGIDTYIKRHGLQDASLAEARRAKRYNVNGAKGEEGPVGAEADTGAYEESELQKAERELEDQEDEDEEDYDPGSDGESEGSGTSSDEDEDEDGEGDEDDEDDEDEEDRDLVKEELGSEAEDIPEDEL